MVYAPWFISKKITSPQVLTIYMTQMEVKEWGNNRGKKPVWFSKTDHLLHQLCHCWPTYSLTVKELRSSIVTDDSRMRALEAKHTGQKFPSVEKTKMAGWFTVRYSANIPHRFLRNGVLLSCVQRNRPWLCVLVEGCPTKNDKRTSCSSASIWRAICLCRQHHP